MREADGYQWRCGVSVHEPKPLLACVDCIFCVTPLGPPWSFRCKSPLALNRDVVTGVAECRAERAAVDGCGPHGAYWNARLTIEVVA